MTTEFTEVIGPPPAAVARPVLPEGSQLTLRSLLRLAWQRRWSLLGAALAGFVLGLVGSLFLPKKYEVHASFIATSGSSIRIPSGISALAGIASQLGVLGASAEGAGVTSPRFYGDLVTSDVLLHQVANTAFLDSTSVPVTTRPLRTIILAHAFPTFYHTPADSLVRAVRRLRGAIVVDVDPRTGLVTVTLTARRAELAAAVMDSLLQHLNQFMTNNLQLQAGARRRFLQRRFEDIQQEVLERQDRLRSFYEANRDYRNAPALVFREAQLRRELETKQDIYTSVARSLEDARMDEVKDTPLLTLIDPPFRPPRPRQPKPLLNGVLLAVFAPLLWLAVVVAVGAPRSPAVVGKRR
jgi:uncharacterized protein involved in exopolysaccharide biosynthesis